MDGVDSGFVVVIGYIYFSSLWWPQAFVGPANTVGKINTDNTILSHPDPITVFSVLPEQFPIVQTIRIGREIRGKWSKMLEKWMPAFGNKTNFHRNTSRKARSLYASLNIGSLVR